MADFNFFLNRQGVRGNKGEQGEQGYSPRITVKTETASEYVLNVQNEDGSFDTPNLRGNAIENLGGSYVRFNQNTEQMYTGYADTASTTSQGEVTLSTYEDLASGGDESEVTTSKDVHDFVEAKISEASVNYVDIDDYTQKMSELDGEISDLDNNKLDFTGLANTLAAGTNITITPNTSTGKITIAGEPVSQAQADWNQSDDTAPDYIKNKPTIPEAITVDSELSSTSTNPVENRLITNAINLISNEFENYATNKLDNLSNEGESRLHALKAYSDNGEVLTDEEGLADVKRYAHSTFDLSKFTVVGSPTISADGIASGFKQNSKKYIKVADVNSIDFSKPWEIDLLVYTGEIYTTGHHSHWFLSGLSTTTRAIHVGFNNNKSIEIFMSYNGTDWLVASVLGNYKYQGFTSYYIRIKYDTTKYTIMYSLDGVNYYVDFEINKTTPIYNGGLKLGNNELNGNSYEGGSIDLKQFSITVDGVEVFSGNKTGLDVIKPDDYAVVGTPTISEDGVLVNTTSNNGYLKSPANLISSSSSLIEYHFRLKLNSISHSDITNNEWGLLRGYNFRLFQSASGYLQYRGNTPEAFISTVLNNDKYSLGETLDFYIVQTATSLYTKITSVDRNTVIAERTDSNLTFTLNPSEALQLLTFSSSDLYINQNCSADLNYLKIYVDGNLVYQPCLKIPYTESKTGSKIVNAVYRDRVNDMAEQFGYANYYTLDENNGTFTLPQVELYGLIEKAASTVPSGVVQSSTINNIVSLTQAEYDALTTKDANTFYVITPST